MQKKSRFRLTRSAAPYLAFLLTLPAACTREATPVLPETAAGGAEQAQACLDDGFLHVELFGAIAETISLDARSLKCEGMPRPEGAGARLRFAAANPEDSRIAIIIAMPDLERGTPANELPSNVTIIQEGDARFFSAVDLESCWTDITSQSHIDGDRYSIAGIVYCISPLAEINGEANISLRDLSFSGVLDWSAR